MVGWLLPTGSAFGVDGTEGGIAGGGEGAGIVGVAVVPVGEGIVGAVVDVI